MSGGIFTGIAVVDAHLAEVKRMQAECAVIAAAFKAAAGFYECPCGSVFEFTTDSTLEEYAALNRWLGSHIGGRSC